MKSKLGSDKSLHPSFKRSVRWRVPTVFYWITMLAVIQLPLSNAGVVGIKPAGIEKADLNSSMVKSDNRVMPLPEADRQHPA